MKTFKDNLGMYIFALTVFGIPVFVNAPKHPISTVILAFVYGIAVGCIFERNALNKKKYERYHEDN